MPTPRPHFLRRHARSLTAAAAILLLAWWLIPWPKRGNVPMFSVPTIAAEAFYGLEVRTESPEGEVVLIRPAPYADRGHSPPVFRFDARTGKGSLVDPSAWDTALGKVGSHKENASWRLSPRTASTAPTYAPPSHDTPREIVEQLAAKYVVDGRACPCRESVAEVVSGDGPDDPGSVILPGSGVSGQYYLELRDTEHPRRIGRAIPIQITKRFGVGCWSGDGRFIVYRSQDKLAIVPISMLTDEKLCPDPPQPADK